MGGSLGVLSGVLCWFCGYVLVFLCCVKNGFDIGIGFGLELLFGLFFVCLGNYCWFLQYIEKSLSELLWLLYCIMGVFVMW